MKNIILALIILIGLSILFIVFSYIAPDSQIEVNNFEDCVKEGNPIMESYPSQCRSKAGDLFVEDIGNEIEKMDLIRITSPRPNEEIKSPLKITGEARGPWFFEASFPVVLTDWDGRIIASHYIMTASEWMTRDFVPFEGEIVFDTPDLKVSNRGSLILQKDNPSGLPEHDDALEIPIKFKTAGKPNKCIVTGCSSQVCSDREIDTTCEYLPEYACYRQNFAVCEPQKNGKCGWSENSELLQCLAGASGISGKITLGPICPVVSSPPQNNCDDKPYKTEVIVFDENGVSEIKRFSSDSEGRFYVQLLPGTYVLEPQSPKNVPFPSASRKTVLVEEGNITEIEIQFDTGIR